jgi:cytochrome c oxidase subunit 2
MIGWVEVMEPTEYQKWLAGGPEGSLASQGEKLFQKYACNTCHLDAATGRGPTLAGLYGKTQPLADGTSVVVDDTYIRESILDPSAYLVPGPNFAPGGHSLMPTNFGQTLTSKQIDELVAYLQTLR